MNKKNSADLLLKARLCAFRLLKFRLRSENEIRQRLKRKKIPEDIIKETILFLKEKKFIDDRQFAKLWTDSRLRSDLGFKRINRELRVKGIDSEVIEEITADQKKDYCEEKIVYALAKERWPKLKSLEGNKARQRLYAWLLRRGFTPDVVIDVINKICKPIY